jgi:hypothetical protein
MNHKEREFTGPCPTCGQGYHGRVLEQVLEAIKDAQLELDSPEVVELTSFALDRKLDAARSTLEEILSD